MAASFEITLLPTEIYLPIKRIITLYCEEDYSKILDRIRVGIRPDLLMSLILNPSIVDKQHLDNYLYKSWMNPSFLQFTIFYLWTRIHLACKLIKEGMHGLETFRKWHSSRLTLDRRKCHILSCKLLQEATLTHLQDNGYVMIFLVYHCCDPSFKQKTQQQINSKKSSTSNKPDLSTKTLVVWKTLSFFN